MEKITTKQEGNKISFWFNTVYLGYAYIEVDGFYQYQFPKENNGVWSAWALREIANILDTLNKPYEDHIAEYFKLAENNTNWISVKERMPEDEVLLLTFSRKIIIGDWYEDKWRSTGRWRFDDSQLRFVSDFQTEDITHWMPLPEPPTE